MLGIPFHKIPYFCNYIYLFFNFLVDDSDTAELGLAIEMSLKDSDKDTTVENFLRSLEGKSLEIKSDVQHLTWGRTMRDFSG